MRFTLIEWLVGILILLVLTRLFWASEIASFENSIFESIGLGGGAKYLIAVPPGIWLMYRLFKREQAKAKAIGAKMVSTQVMVLAIGLLALAAGVLIFSSRL